MPDNETSVDIVIRTRAELEGAQSAEAQLDRDIGKARELGQEYAAQDERRRQSPDAMEQESLPREPLESEPETGGSDADAPNPQTGPGPASPPQGHDFSTSDLRAVEQQAESIQATGERMRAAFEQNGQMMLGLLKRTLELMEEQNRRLSDVDRQLGQLAGRIKGMKNP